MKKILAVAVLMLVCASAAFAADAVKNPLSYWVGVSFNKITNSGAPSGGPGGLVGLNYAVTPDIAVGVAAGYLMMGSTDIPLLNGTETDKLSTIPIIVHGMYMIPMQGNFKPYVGAGLGMYMLRTSADAVYTDGTAEATASTTNSKLGFNGGVGFCYNSGGSMGYGLDARFHIISSPVDGGDSYKLLTIAGTVSFK